MNRAVIIDENGAVEETSGREFFSRIFGHPPRTKEQPEAEDAAYWAEYRKEARRELEELRDRLCKLASAKLAAEWREKWAKEDALREAGEQRRVA